MRASLLNTIVVAVTVLLGSSVGSFFSIEIWDRINTFDSGWVAASNAKSNSLIMEHGLGRLPKSLTIWFSSTNSGNSAYPLLADWTPSDSGNPICIRADQRVVEICIYEGYPLRGVYNSKTTLWERNSTGFFRVVAR